MVHTRYGYLYYFQGDRTEIIYSYVTKVTLSYVGIPEICIITKLNL